MKKYKGYIASHFFNRGGYLQTEELATYLIKEFPQIDWYVPHRNDDINDKKVNDDIITDKAIYKADAEKIIDADILIANMDGVEIDSGVGGEMMSRAVLNDIGYGEYPSLIVGYTTDMRINRASDDFIEDLLSEAFKENGILEEKLENHKENFLYRNRMITGAASQWGSVVNEYATNTEYLYVIADEIREYLEEREA